MSITPCKQCKQCGEIKPLEQFRQYYGGRKGYYTICRSCEKINSRAKYIERKGQAATQLELIELEKIHRLYDAQQACGLQPPRRTEGRKTNLTDDLDSMITTYTSRANTVADAAQCVDTDNTPPELANWLTAVLDKEPDYYLDDVYDALQETYRKVLSIDKDTMLPVYDNTYKTILDTILARFNAYEDTYYDS